VKKFAVAVMSAVDICWCAHNCFFHCLGFSFLKMSMQRLT